MRKMDVELKYARPPKIFDALVVEMLSLVTSDGFVDHMDSFTVAKIEIITDQIVKLAKKQGYNPNKIDRVSLNKNIENNGPGYTEKYKQETGNDECPSCGS